MWLILLSILAGFILIALLALTIPVTITISVAYQKKWDRQVIIAWLFGRLRYAPTGSLLTESGKRIKNRFKKKVTPTETEKDTPTETDKDTSAKHGGDFTDAILQIQGFKKRIRYFLQDLLGVLRLRTLRVDGRIGLDDPYDTGRFWGLFSALTGILHVKRQIKIAIEPEFNAAVFELDGHGVLSFTPLRILSIATLFLLSPPTVRAIWTAIKWRRRSKKSEL